MTDKKRRYSSTAVGFPIRNDQISLHNGIPLSFLSPVCARVREGAAAVATLRPHAATPPKAHPLTPTTTPMSPRHAAFLLLLVHAVCLHYPRKTNAAYRHMAKTIIIRKAARRGERYLFSLLRLCHILRTLIGSAKYRTIATIHKAAATR